MKCTKQNGAFYIQGFGKTLCLKNGDKIDLSSFVKQFKGVSIDDNISKATNISLLEAVQMMKNNKEISEWLYKAIGAKAAYGKSKEIVEVPVYDEAENEELRSEISRLKEKIDIIENGGEGRREEIMEMLQERMQILQCSDESVEIMNDICTNVLNMLEDDEVVVNETGIEYLLERLPKLADETALVVERNALLTDIKRYDGMTDLSDEDRANREQLLIKLSEITSKIHLEEELEEMRREYYEKCEELVDLEKEHKKLVIEMEAVNENNTELQDRNISLLADIEKVNAEKNLMGQRIVDIEKGYVNAMNNKKKELKQKIRELNAANDGIAMLKRENEIMRENNEKIINELENYKRNPKYVNKAKIAELENTIRRLNDVLEEGDKSMRKLMESDSKTLEGSTEEQLKKIEHMVDVVLMFKHDIDREREKMQEQFEIEHQQFENEKNQQRKAFEKEMEEQVLNIRRESASHRDMAKYYNELAKKFSDFMGNIYKSKESTDEKKARCESLLEGITEELNGKIEECNARNAQLASINDELQRNLRDGIEEKTVEINSIRDELKQLQNHFINYIAIDANNVGVDQKIKVVDNARRYIDDCEGFIEKLQKMQEEIDKGKSEIVDGGVGGKVEGGNYKVYGGERPSALVINDIFVRMEIFVFGIIIVVVLMIVMIIWNNNKECERKKRDNEWKVWKDITNDFPVWNPL